MGRGLGVGVCVEKLSETIPNGRVVKNGCECLIKWRWVRGCLLGTIQFMHFFVCPVPYTLKRLRWINFHVFRKLVYIHKIKTAKSYWQLV